MTPQELKNSILLKAVNGGLVPQNSNEEPAIFLVEESRKKQRDLLAKKLIKKEKYNQNIETDEELPQGWCYVKLGELTSVVTKQTGFDYSSSIKPNLSEVKLDGMIPMVQTKNFKGKQFDLNTDYFIPLNIAKQFPKIMLDSQCMLLSIVGASIGNIGIYDKDALAIIGGAICKVSLIDKRLYDYLYLFLQSPSGQKEIKKNLKATAQGTITVQDVREIQIKMPPLAEQKRIVAKIEELLPLIDRYEKAWRRLGEFNKRFPDDMQKSILQMAIQGKLVEQRSDEGTGEELYKEIKTENIDIGAIRKKGKGKSVIIPIEEEDIPFDIPESWIWVRLGTIGYTNIGLTYSPKDVSNEGTIVLRSSNIQEGKMDYHDIVRVSMDIPENKMCHKGDILICARNGSKRLVGKSAIIDTDGMSFGAFMAIFRSVCNEYIFQVINSAYFRNALLGDIGTTTINQITQDMLKNVLIPLPPISEQKRIVAKLKELLPMCEKIKEITT